MSKLTPLIEVVGLSFRIGSILPETASLGMKLRKFLRLCSIDLPKLTRPAPPVFGKQSGHPNPPRLGLGFLIGELNMAHVFMLAALSLIFATPAWADRIDGDWCAKDGHQLSIMGSAIITPGGANIRGDYGRHDFAYVAPAGDKDSGTQIFLRLQGETAMNFYRLKDGQLGEPELWRRCDVRS